MTNFLQLLVSFSALISFQLQLNFFLGAINHSSKVLLNENISSISFSHGVIVLNEYALGIPLNIKVTGLLLILSLIISKKIKTAALIA